MATVREIAGYLEERVPSSLKLDFDNVGLLCGFPEREVSRVLVVLDITQQAIEEALSLHAELIVSHHPVIFTPLRRVCTDTPDAKRVIALLQGNLSAICLHTNLDALEGGVNTALANAGVPESLYDVATFVLYQQYASNPQISQAQALVAVKAVMQNDTLRNQAILTFNNLGAQGQMAINGLRLTLAKSALKPEIDAALSKLDGYKELYEGIYKYTAGVSQVQSGVNELSSKLPALKSGVGQLKDGAGNLNDGLKQFNEQGIKKITDLANGDVRNLVVRAKATVDVSKNYKSFSGISDEMDGSVKFVYKTDSIKADK